LEYDIQQRDLLASNPAHDLSTLDSVALTVIATRPVASVSPKRQRSSSDIDRHSDSSHAKRPRSICFRCGLADHLPATCSAERTVAGVTPASLLGDPAWPNALKAPGGKQFCFSWMQRSNCSFGPSCSHFHGCSICGNLSHGAAGCKSLS
jgi:hypothetical protein